MWRIHSVKHIKTIEFQSEGYLTSYFRALSFVNRPLCTGCRDEADEFVEIGALNGIFVLGRSMGFIGNVSLLLVCQFLYLFISLSYFSLLLNKYQLVLLRLISHGPAVKQLFFTLCSLSYQVTIWTRSD